MSALAAEGVTFRYGAGDEAVLRGVTLSVARGEVLGVLGPNGAGKSTLLRVLAGLVRPEAGAVTVQGDALTELPRMELARRMALVPQRETVPSGLTVEQVVSLGRAPYTGWFGGLTARDRDAVREALERCDVGALRGRPFELLSGGEQKRCLVARALAQQTGVLLLDEPVASLDLGHQIAVCDLFAARAREGAAVVVVLHDPNLAARYCDRVMMLQRGRDARIATVAEALTRETLREVFSVETHVGVCDDDGRPFFVALRGR